MSRLKNETEPAAPERTGDRTFQAEATAERKGLSIKGLQGRPSWLGMSRGTGRDEVGEGGGEELLVGSEFLLGMTHALKFTVVMICTALRLY